MKRIVFLTGTRADYGKLKSIMLEVDKSPNFDLHVFITGMHMHSEFGSTYNEVLKDGYKNTFMFINQRVDQPMDTTLSKTVDGFSSYIAEVKPDLIIVHGDRLEALAATIVGAMNNILVGHIEGGEVSGTIDESIRHAVTKLAHIHFVSNEESKNRILQLGEQENRVFVVGSPDIDIMLSPNIPSIEKTKQRYDINFDEYALALFHPVTTSFREMANISESFVKALEKSNKNYVLIHPNNDYGRTFIVEAYQKLETNKRFRVFQSIRFEYFLSLLKHANFMIGNSSAGIREAFIYRTPSIDIGNRQKGRYQPSSYITHSSYCTDEILNAINNISKDIPPSKVDMVFGEGDSKDKFMKILDSETIWSFELQKYFMDKG